MSSSTGKTNIRCNIHRPDTSGRFCVDCGAEIKTKKETNGKL